MTVPWTSITGTPTTLAGYGITSPLDVAEGGTAISSYTAGDALYASGPTAFTKLAIGAANTVLTSTGSVPQWATVVPGGMRTVTDLPTYLANNAEANVVDFGADATGVVDSTSAFNAAIASLPNGGIVRLPSGGEFKCNIVITAADIQIRGAGGMGVNSIRGALIANNTALPVLTIGDGTTNCDGFGLSDVMISASGGGTAGVKINGASRCNFINFAIKGFSGQGLFITSSATVPTTYQTFSSFSIEAGSGAGAIGVDMLYGSQYVTAVNFIGGHVSGPSGTGLFAMQNDGCVVNVTDVWFQCSNGMGLNSKNVGIYIGSGVDVDSSLSTDVLLQTDVDVLPVQRFRGSISVDGLMQTPSGNTAQLTGTAFRLYDSSFALNTFIQSNLFFTDSSLAPHLQNDNTDQTVGLRRSGSTLAATGAWTFAGAVSVLSGDVRISAGTLGIAAAPTTWGSIVITGTLTGNANQYAIHAQATFDSTATSNGAALYAKVTTAASIFTLSRGYGLQVDVPSIGVGSAVGTLYGMFVASQTGATTNYAIYTNAGLVHFSDATSVQGSFTNSNAFSITPTMTSVGSGARGVFVGPTLTAAANGEPLTGAQVNPAFTPGSFTGLVATGMIVNGFNVAGFMLPGDPITLNVGSITGTGATNAYSIKLGAGPSGATNNYLIHATNFQLTSAGALSAAGAVTAGGGLASTFLDSGSATDLLLKRNGTTLLTVGALTVTLGGSLTTAAPSGGTAGAWKGGILVTAAVTPDTTRYIQLDVGGTLYKLIVST